MGVSVSHSPDDVTGCNVRKNMLRYDVAIPLCDITGLMMKVVLSVFGVAGLFVGPLTRL